MPQYLLKVSPERALKFYGVNVIEGSATQEVQGQSGRMGITVKTGGGTLPLDRDGDPNDLDDNQQTTQPSGSLF